MRGLCGDSVGAALALILVAARGEACSCYEMCCGRGVIAPATGRVPANVPALAWWPGPGRDVWCPARVGRAEEVAWMRLDAGGASQPVSFSFETAAVGHLLRPAEPLVVGASYRLVTQNTCPAHFPVPAMPETQRAEFEVGPAAPLPTTLGTVVGEPPGRRWVQVAANGGTCGLYLESSAVEIQLRHSPEAEPWASLFLYETLVDGQPWQYRLTPCDIPPHGQSRHGRGRDVVFAVCANQSGTPLLQPSIPPGRHTLRFRATLPGVSAPLESEPFEVDFNCDAPLPDAGFADAGAPDASLADALTADVIPADAGRMDAGLADARTADVGGADARGSDVLVADETSRAPDKPDAAVANTGAPAAGRLVAACGCRAARRGSLPTLGWTIGLALLARRRRATRRGRGASNALRRSEM